MLSYQRSHLWLPVLGLALASSALADGTEQLGTPSIPIADGTDVIVAGIGFSDGNQPDTVNFDVGAGLDVLQVIGYWEGFAESAAEQGATDTIQIDFGSGFVDVVGTRIGGPSEFIQSLGLWTTTYRVELDTTLVVTGANSWDVQGLDFAFVNNGFGVMVVVEDPSADTGVQVKDGNDGAFVNFAPPFDKTAEVEFTYSAVGTDRDGALSHFVASVSSQSTFGPDRPTIIQVGFDDDPFSVFEFDRFGVNADPPPGGSHTHDGDWDVLRHVFTVPAGSSKVRVQILSQDSGMGKFAGNLPASLVWTASAFTLEEPEDGGAEGCTPGYWKNHEETWAFTAYQPDDVFDTVFGTTTFGTMTLMDVVRQGGGCEKALGRHAVAALLNASHPDIDYAISDPDDVIAAVKAALDTGDCEQIETVKDILDEYNNAGCFDDGEEDAGFSGGRSGGGKLINR